MVKYIFNESQFKTILTCPKLYALDGSINNYDPSQQFIRHALQLFFLKIIKGNIASSIDTSINDSVNKAYKAYYGLDSQDPSFVVDIKAYAFAFINSFITLFNFTEYEILSKQMQPLLDYENFSLKISFDAIYKQVNRTGFLHAVCFYPLIDKHVLRNDFLLNLKLQYLKQFASFSIPKEKYQEVTIHLLAVPKFNKYKTKRSAYSFVHKKITYADYKHTDLSPYFKKANENLLNPIAPPYCPNTKCSKRDFCNV
jgi:hypothetical protein